MCIREARQSGRPEDKYTVRYMRDLHIFWAPSLARIGDPQHLLYRLPPQLTRTLPPPAPQQGQQAQRRRPRARRPFLCCKRRKSSKASRSALPISSCLTVTPSVVPPERETLEQTDGHLRSNIRLDRPARSKLALALPLALLLRPAKPAATT